MTCETSTSSPTPASPDTGARRSEYPSADAPPLSFQRTSTLRSPCTSVVARFGEPPDSASVHVSFSELRVVPPPNNTAPAGLGTYTNDDCNRASGNPPLTDSVLHE